MSWLVSDFIRLNHCLLQPYLQKERWFVQDLLWWWRRGQGGLRWFCPVLPRKLPSCRLPFLFLSPLIANGTNYFCLTNHIQWEADHWLLRENQRHFMELNTVREFFRAKSVSSIEADDHFKEAADAKTKHHIWNTRQNTICSETLERKRTTNKRRRIEEKKTVKLSRKLKSLKGLKRRIVTLSSLKLTQSETNLLAKGLNFCSTPPPP